MENTAANLKPEGMELILATDCGSTTSKARLFKKIGSEYRFVASGEAPTTVEAPFEDVTMGVRNAIREIEEILHCELLDDNGIITPKRGSKGVDLYVTTSSAGGGLQMLVCGLIKTMTTESAERAALGAGAVVCGCQSVDDQVQIYDKIKAVRYLRPDMILMAGGTDGGSINQVVEIAETLRAADPTPRLGESFKLPLVYAGNKDARKKIEEILSETFLVTCVDNIRPSLDVENPIPSREVIAALFLEHVMSHAPGYAKLMKWTPVPIMPTPAAEGTMFQTLAATYNTNVIGVGLGGATTNVYSIYKGKFVRTVSANLGMSYSICNVLKEAGISNILRWIPFDVSEADVRDRLRNKMIRPTTIPQTLEELVIEHAVAREALRLGFKHHKSLARPLRGIVRARGVDIFDQRTFEETYIDMLKIGWLVGTGGLLSHATRRSQSALMLMDGFQPEGITKLAQDSVFMIPHLGVLSTVHPKAAVEIFEKDCLVHIGTSIAPRGTGKEGDVVVKIVGKMPDGSAINEEAKYGSMKKIQLGEGERAEIEVFPGRGFDVGDGPGKRMQVAVEGGAVGIIIDARGRPLKLPEQNEERRQRLHEWYKAVDAYPEDCLK